MLITLIQTSMVYRWTFC